MNRTGACFNIDDWQHLVFFLRKTPNPPLPSGYYQSLIRVRVRVSRVVRVMKFSLLFLGRFFSGRAFSGVDFLHDWFNLCEAR